MFKLKGYTLIEILIVLTVVAILFGAGFVGYRDFSRRQVVLGAAKIIQGDLRRAQQNALSGIKPDDPKCTNPNTLTGYNFKVASGTTYSIEADCSGGTVKIGDDHLLPNGIHMTVPSPNPILFRILGLGTNITGTDTSINLTQDLTTNTSTILIGSGGDIK